MNVYEKVQQIAGTIEGLHFQFNDWTRGELSLELNQLPACLYLLPVSGEMNMRNGHFRDRPNALIAFVDRADSTPAEQGNREVVERMKLLARRFVVAVNASGLFEALPETVPYATIYDTVDADVIGVALQVQLRELQGTCQNGL